MGDTNPNIQRVSFEEIQEFKDLDLFNLTWEQTNGRQVLLAYDPRSRTFGFTYAAPGTDGGNQNITLFYGHSAVIADFIDNNSLGARPSINGFDNGDGILTMDTVGSVLGFSFYDVEIDVALDIDRYVFRTSFLPEKGDKGDVGDTGPAGAVGPIGDTGDTGAAGATGPAGASAITDQKFITYPADFDGTSYTLTDADNNKCLFVINDTTDVTIAVPLGLQGGFQVGLVRDGTGGVFIGSSFGMSIKNALGAFNITNQYDQAFVEQGITPAEYYVFGNTST